MRLLAVTVWAFVCVTLLGVLAYSMLLWSQYWRWATPRNTGVRAAAPRRRSYLSSGYSNASMGGGVLQPHRMAPLPKDKLFAKVEAYRAQLERQLRRAQWDSVRPVGAGGRPASDRYGLRPSRRKPARFAPPDRLLARAKALRMRMLTRDTEPFKRMGYSQYFPPTDFYASQFNSCALVSSAGSMLGSKLGPEIVGGASRVRPVPGVLAASRGASGRAFLPAAPGLGLGSLALPGQREPGARAQEPAVQRIPRASPAAQTMPSRGRLRARALDAADQALPLLRGARGPGLHPGGLAPAGRREAARAAPRLVLGARPRAGVRQGNAAAQRARRRATRGLSRRALPCHSVERATQEGAIYHACAIYPTAYFVGGAGAD
ncbi:uncharacterized protein LOC142571407 isoform X3 [Dermacentor variabilis]|uniref:uncharacterized protein LOC142571407 isoform X3 n=1 Tax=Dermacentor variabilis TaxID=34621 RepID=UPI003F5BCA06